MRYLDNFSFQVLGNENGPKLVFLHGLMGSGANWRKVTSAFEKDYHILVYDQRGHGRSFKPESGYAPENYADDLALILDELGWASIMLVGHSMGGRNAQNFASRWPHRVNCLVIEDIGPDATPQGVEQIKTLLSLVPVPFVSRSVAKQFLLEQFPKLIPQNPQPMVLAQYFYSNIEEKNGVATWRFSESGILSSVEEGRLRDRWHEFEGLRVQTLVVRGERSDELSSEVLERMCQVNPRVRGVEIAGAAHWVHFDQPGRFVEELQKFFNEIQNRK